LRTRLCGSGARHAAGHRAQRERQDDSVDHSAVSMKELRQAAAPSRHNTAQERT